ncbi:MFS transporter [Labrys wisconsinensis]|uniref:MFS family permease n=1 Tax=Labrys wisconsinensis TaxID=425677 RepID=A0ABU0JEM6_9HYPH|nr:MFS transporter [Labrys wisconsinensis]MDQ0472065.1 MFS family permease [Labrys wisconsinensis]
MTAMPSSAPGLRQTLALAREILPLMAAICIAGSGNGLLTTVVSLHLGSGRFDAGAVRMILSGFPAGFLLGCLLAHGIVARLGHERTFRALAVLTALAGLGFAPGEQPLLWFGLRLVNGLSMAILFIVAESWINLYAGARNRGTLFSLYMLMTSLSVLLGQLMVRLADPQGAAPFILAAGVGLGGVLVSRFVTRPWPALPVPEPPLPAEPARVRESFGLWRLACLAPVTVIAAFQAGMTNLNVFAMTPLYGEQVGLPATTVIGLTTAFSIGGLLAQSPIGWLSDHVDRRLLLVLTAGLAALLCGSIALASDGPALLLFALFFAYGAVTLTIYPLAVAYGNARLESRFMVLVSGRLLLLYAIGGVAAPLLSTDLMQRFGPGALFVLLGSGAFCVTVAACFNLLRSPVPAGGTESAPALDIGD